MDKETYVRLLEKVIDNIPPTIAAIAALITALNVREQNKKRQPKSRKRKR